MTLHYLDFLRLLAALRAILTEGAKGGPAAYFQSAPLPSTEPPSSGARYPPDAKSWEGKGWRDEGELLSKL